MSSNPLDLYDYELPPERIAQEPPARRGDSRLLVLDRADGNFEAGMFDDLIKHVRAGDLMVFNDVRVYPARLRLQRSGGGDAELLFLQPTDLTQSLVNTASFRWEVLIRPARWARRLMKRDQPIEIPGSTGDKDVAARVHISHEFGRGRFEITVQRGTQTLQAAEVIELCEALGEVPLPPYIHRERQDPRGASDRQRYQTIYARAPLAVAAPTAGLHFSSAMLEALQATGIERATITHQVGIGTFQPISVNDLGGDTLHPELSLIDEASARAIIRAREESRRIIAVGTTTVRALESFARAGTPIPYRASTQLFIKPGHRFRLVDALLTNFHLPRSSLMVLVSAFAGREHILAAYRHAIDAKFNFYSYGDAMLIR